MTPDDAQALHDDAAARGRWLIWTLTDTDLEHPGKYIARAHETDHHGGNLAARRTGCQDAGRAAVDAAERLDPARPDLSITTGCNRGVGLTRYPGGSQPPDAERGAASGRYRGRAGHPVSRVWAGYWQR